MPRYHVNKLPYYLRLQFEVLQLEVVTDVPHCFAIEDLKTYHVVKLFCGRRFATLFALCVSTGGVVLSCFAVAAFAVVGVSINDTGSLLLTLLS